MLHPRWIGFAAIFVASIPASAQVAQNAFNQAESLRQQDRWTEACPVYEASYRADPQLGVLLHLAECHEHVGRTATAWAEYTDAIAIAHRKHDQREQIAQERADALAPKVPRLHLSPPPTITPGLVVRLDGVDITVLLGTEMPTNPGDHEVAASAPNHLGWWTTLTIGVGTQRLELPALGQVPNQEVEADRGFVDLGERPGELPGAEVHASNDRDRTMRIAGVAVVAAGAVLGATGLYFGHRASSLGDEVTSACAHGCNWAELAAKDSQGKSDARKQWVFGGAGAVAIITGGIVYWLGTRSRAASSVAITSRRDGLAVAWSGSW